MSFVGFFLITFLSTQKDIESPGRDIPSNASKEIIAIAAAGAHDVVGAGDSVPFPAFAEEMDMLAPFPAFAEEMDMLVPFPALAEPVGAQDVVGAGDPVGGPSVLFPPLE
jgi:hypothetical protein